MGGMASPLLNSSSSLRPPSRSISETPPQPPTPALLSSGPLRSPFPRLLPAASVPTASGNIWNSERPRRWWLRRVRSDGGFDQTGAMLPGGERPLTCAQLPGPPRFMEPRWEPGLQPVFSWHGAVLTEALGRESCPVSPKRCAVATGRTPGCCQHREGCVQALEILLTTGKDLLKLGKSSQQSPAGTDRIPMAL